MEETTYSLILSFSCRQRYQTFTLQRPRRMQEANHCSHNGGSVLHMQKGDMQSALIKIFAKAMKGRVTTHRNKPLIYLVGNHILNHIEYEWVMPETDTCRKR